MKTMGSKGHNIFDKDTVDKTVISQVLTFKILQSWFMDFIYLFIFLK